MAKFTLFSILVLACCSFTPASVTNGGTDTRADINAQKDQIIVFTPELTAIKNHTYHIKVEYQVETTKYGCPAAETKFDWALADAVLYVYNNITPTAPAPATEICSTLNIHAAANFQPASASPYKGVIDCTWTCTASDIYSFGFKVNSTCKCLTGGTTVAQPIVHYNLLKFSVTE